jgi:beta-phosphoglucomutase
MQRLDADASDSIAFEDSLSGVRAAVAAGVETVGVMTALSDDVLRGAGATMVVQDFTDPALIEHLHRRASR